MSSKVRRAAYAILVLAPIAVALGCGGSGDAAPTAQAAVLQLDEDQSASITLVGHDPRGEPLTFLLARVPTNGLATLNATTGNLTYRPQRDYFGADSLTFTVASSRGKRSSPATISLTIHPVNDPPVVHAPSSAVNSAYTFETIVPFTASDVDSETLHHSVEVIGEGVIAARVDPELSAIIVSPTNRGEALISLSVSDSVDVTMMEIKFEVTDVQKSVALEIDQLAESAISIHNSLDRPIEFTLEHNGFPSFATVEEVAAYVERSDAAYSGEPFESKLWRFVRDNLFHDYVLTGRSWIYDPLVTINSLGWGLCGNAASLYVRVAHAAGYDARVWELSGHVVPEIFADNAWQVYDPDLAVFYVDESQNVASVDALSADSTLVSIPNNPIHDPQIYPAPYSTYLADIYGSSADNSLMSDLDGPMHSLSGAVKLPAGATLVYPGLWDDGPIGHDGDVQQPVTWFRHALLEVPSGFSGSVHLPWLIRAIRGTGVVRINDVAYATDSDELRSVLREPQWLIERIEVIEATTELGFVFYINAGRFRITPETLVNLTGIDVWAAIVEVTCSPI